MSSAPFVVSEISSASLGNATKLLPLAQEGAQAAGDILGGGFLSMWSHYFEAVALLCFLLGGLWFFLWIIRRKYHGSLPGAIPTMVIESRLALAPKKWVVITRFMNKRLILGVTEQHVTLLSEMPLEAENVESQNQGTSCFSSVFQSAPNTEGN